MTAQTRWQVSKLFKAALNKRREVPEQAAERVQEYTRRGAPMRGRFRLSTPRERRQEIFVGVVIAAAMVLAVLLPALVNSL